MNALLLSLLLGTTDCALCEQVAPNLNVVEACAKVSEDCCGLAHRNPARRIIAAVVKVRPVRAVAKTIAKVKPVRTVARAVAKVKPVRRVLAPLRGRCE